ncbi:unnamed protein product [Bursaphelenchus xylophilus]|uniref:Tyrosine-protein kinase n=1 Tax=Bursaphelenchus xylophilus TaxID=6326 RepID=A0A1I7S8C5_BURXY|nr:unnamed protein product [Bursaphelenchus xylophilus]CAG9120950.1 unnamed protein product [Bursaphelenchus xylophilus]
MKSSEDKKLENQIYYHGIRNREDIVSELKYKGDFAVRASMDSGFPKLVLNVRGSRGPWNLLLDVVDGKYCLRLERKKEKFPSFETVAELIEHYKIYGLPHGPKLRHPIPRPEWLLRHQALNYDPQKDLLGAGNFCSVFKGTMTRNGVCRQVAIKVCHPSDDMTNRQEIHEACQSMLYEAKIMSNYSHENVVELMGIACDHPPIKIALEFCPGGALEDHIKKRTYICNVELTLYAFEAARGMRYLHMERCIHRDLASRNCLISAQGIIKIADFGLSKVAEEFQTQEKALKHIPLRWMAPETIRKPPVYLVNSDVWSFGALLYELFNHGNAPFFDEKDHRAIAKNIRAAKMPDFPARTPEPIKKMVSEEIWVKEPERRILFDKIVVILFNYIESEMDAFPEVRELAVNKIKGVKRTAILTADKETLLREERTENYRSGKRRGSSEEDSPRRSSNRRTSRKSGMRTVPRSRVPSSHRTRTASSARPSSKDTGKEGNSKENSKDSKEMSSDGQGYTKESKYAKVSKEEDEIRAEDDSEGKTPKEMKSK